MCGAVVQDARKARVRMAREEEEEACRLMLSSALSGAQVSRCLRAGQHALHDVDAFSIHA